MAALAVDLAIVVLGAAILAPLLLRRPRMPPQAAAMN
jgi:hypothetical protein